MSQADDPAEDPADEGAPGNGVRPVAVEIAPPGLPILRGQRWGDAPDVLFLHAPGEDRDLNDWQELPALVATETGGSLALDLPGHGLSDDGEDEADPTALLAALLETPEGASIRAVVAAGDMAGDLLAAGPSLGLAGLVCFSASGPAVEEPAALPRSPRLPKLLLARSGGNSAELKQAREVSRAVAGWAVVVGVGGPDGGAALLDGPSAGPVRDHVAGFLRESLGRGTQEP